MLPRELFTRPDDSDDSEFYRYPRKVVHIAAQAIAALGGVFAALLPQYAHILDLMSSWRSHIPPEVSPARVVGLGMNAEEMADNPQLSEYAVHNLNAQPRLPYPDATFDAALCTVSVQYLTEPVAVFQEVNRVLKPGGVFVVSFSNRCFPTKAVAIWQYASDQQHIGLVARYFALSGTWDEVTAQATDAADGYPPDADPLFVVWACKTAHG